MFIQLSEIVATLQKMRTTIKGAYDAGIKPKEAWDRLAVQRGSIAREASKSIYEFPIFVSGSCSYDLAMAVSNAVQARCAIYTKIVFERIGLIDTTIGDTKDSLVNKLKGFNINMGTHALGEAESPAPPVPGTMSLLKEWHGVPASDSGLNMGTIEGKILNEDDGSEPGSKFETERHNKYVWRDDPNDPHGGKIADRVETTVTTKPMAFKQGEAYDPQKLSRAEFEEYRDRKNQEKNEDQARETRKQEVELAERGKIGKTIASIGKDSRRSNPTTIEVDIEYKTSLTISSTKFTIGVRAVVHPIPGDEIVKFVPTAKFDMSPLIRLAQLTTGEIGLVKDFILGLDLIRKDANPHSSGTGAWYAKLKALTRDNRSAKYGGVKGEMPTATLVVAMEDVDEMLRATRGRFDLRDASIARHVVESLSLMGLIIADEATERLWWYEDVHRGYSFYSPKDLEESHNGMSEKDLLKVFLAVNK